MEKILEILAIIAFIFFVIYNIIEIILANKFYKKLEKENQDFIDKLKNDLVEKVDDE